VGAETVRLGAEVPIERSPGAETVGDAVRRNVRAVKATIFGLAGARGARDRVAKRVAGVAKQRDEGVSAPGTSSGERVNAEFERLQRAGKVVEPPFDPLFLAVMPENNTEIGPAIDAMSVNVESFGWRLRPRFPVTERTDPELLRILAEEATAAENFFESACAEGAIEDLRDKLRRDLESTGNNFTEFVEVPGTGELDGLEQLPAWTMRITKPDDEPTEYVDYRVVKEVSFPPPPPAGEPGELAPPEPGEGEAAVRKQLPVEVRYRREEHLRRKRFRRYVQVLEGGRAVWFKELGDPRLISSRTGEVVTREQLTEGNKERATRFTLSNGSVVVRTNSFVGFPVADAANPVRHQRIYCPRSPYGLPRYIGNLFAIMGSRASEEINYTTFKNNNVPSLAISVSNGKLDDESIERIDEFVEAAIQGDDNYSKFLLIEAEPVMEGMRDPGSMKIDITPLTKEQHTDALFVNYKAANDESVRRVWRFPSLFVGKAEDYSGDVVDASRRLGDEQVFEPERDKVDRFFTRDVLLRLNIVNSVFRSNGPNVAENADLVRILAGGEKTGGATPRIARKILSRIVNEDLGEVDPKLLDPDKPFSLTLAEIMKTNSASAAPGGGEPTSQGRAGLQVATEGERDRDLEPAGTVDRADEPLERLAELLRAEAARRFGGFVPPALDLREGEGDA